MALFSVAEARAFTQGGGQPLASISQYPNAQIEAAAARIKERFEDYCDVAFEPATATEALNGSGKDYIILLRTPVISLTSAMINGVAADESTLKVDSASGMVFHPFRWPKGRLNVEIVYEHGHATVPLDIKRAALQVAVYEVKGTDVPQRATSQTDEFGRMQLATAGRNRPYGIPEVDAVLNDRRNNGTVR